MYLRVWLEMIGIAQRLDEKAVVVGSIGKRMLKDIGQHNSATGGRRRLTGWTMLAVGQGMKKAVERRDGGSAEVEDTHWGQEVRRALFMLQPKW